MCKHVSSRVLVFLPEVRHLTESIESLNEPAKLAERVLAPGESEAEPGVTAHQFRKACEAGDRWLIVACNENPESKLFFARFLCRPLRGLRRICGFPSPGSASPSPGASTLTASFAGWLSGLFPPTPFQISLLPNTCIAAFSCLT